jgi:hypothetical protein
MMTGPFTLQAFNPQNQIYSTVQACGSGFHLGLALPCDYCPQSAVDLGMCIDAVDTVFTGLALVSDYSEHATCTC